MRRPGRSKLRWFFLAPMCAICLLASSASAADPKSTPDERQARALFDQGLALSDDGKWAEALDVFRKADGLVHSASVRFNIAVTLRALGKYVEAKRIADELLEKGVDDKPLKPALRAEVQKLRDEVAPKIVRVEIKRSPVDGDVEIDGSPATIGADGRIELDPGKHVFVLRKTGYDTATVTKSLESTDSEVVLTAPKTKIAPPPPPPKEPIYKRGWFWGTVGAVVVAGAAVTVGVLVLRPDASGPAAPPESTMGRVIPASYTVRF